MSWKGLRHKGTEILFSWEWNAVVDALDELYSRQLQTLTKQDLLYLDSDIIPDQDNVRDLGSSERQWNEVYAHYGYFSNNLFIQGKQALKDGDPVITYMFTDYAKDDIEKIYTQVKRPVGLQTQRLLVGTTPVPLSDVDMVVKRIHIKVPSWALYLVYVGDATRQEFVLEPKDKEVFEVENPKNVYVRSLGNVEVFIAFEV